ncbi:hypothetical protein BC30102_p639 (plasmid) [Bacillus cereus]|nr:hypothetical protein BC30102_p639 [Bacillus cereus]
MLKGDSIKITTWSYLKGDNLYMLETIEMRKKQHEIKIHKYKNIQKYYNSFLFAISIIYFLYFIIIDHSLSAHPLQSFIIGFTLEYRPSYTSKTFI